MSDDGLRFTENEVAQILWALFESAELASQIDALSTQAMIEEVTMMVKERFDRRGGG